MSRPSPDRAIAPERFWVETLGCPKNAVDSDKVTASLLGDGWRRAELAEAADLVVVNTCAFIEAARQESIETILALSDAKPGARLVVTGCMAERYGDELAAALPEADAVVGFAGEGTLSQVVLKRPPSSGPRTSWSCPGPSQPPPGPTSRWRKAATGSAPSAPSRRSGASSGPARAESIEAEARALVEGGVAEIVLVAQDLASYGRDVGAPGRWPRSCALDRWPPTGCGGSGSSTSIPRRCAIRSSPPCSTPTVVPYFDLSLQHASESLVRRMRRWGSGGASWR